jgi:hypothetical protein
MDQSPLAKLPQKLRNRVFRYALTAHHDNELGSPRAIYVDELRLDNGLTATCRQLRTESLSLFYSTNDFVTCSLTRRRLRDLITAISVDTFCSIRSFRCCWSGSSPIIVGYKSSSHLGGLQRSPVKLNPEWLPRMKYAFEAMQDAGMVVEEVKAKDGSKWWVVSPASV